MAHKTLVPTIVLRGHVFACGLRPMQLLLRPCLFMFHKLHLLQPPCLCLGPCTTRHPAYFRARALDKTLSSVSESTAVLSFRHVPSTLGTEVAYRPESRWSAGFQCGWHTDANIMITVLTIRVLLEVTEVLL